MIFLLPWKWICIIKHCNSALWSVLPGCEWLQFNFSLVKNVLIPCVLPTHHNDLDCSTWSPVSQPWCNYIAYSYNWLNCSYTSNLSGMATTVLQHFFTVKSWSLSSSSLSKTPLGVACPATMLEYGSFKWELLIKIIINNHVSAWYRRKTFSIPKTKPCLNLRLQEIIEAGLCT